MGLVVLIALGLRRPRAAVSGLLASVSVLLLIDPWLSLSLGFALSTAATGGLVAWSCWQVDRLSSPAHWLRAALLVTLAAQVATAPLVAAAGNGVAVIGVIANLLAMPAVATPAMTSASGNLSSIMFASSLFTKSRT